MDGESCLERFFGVGLIVLLGLFVRLLPERERRHA